MMWEKLCGIYHIKDCKVMILAFITETGHTKYMELITLLMAIGHKGPSNPPPPSDSSQGKGKLILQCVWEFKSTEQFFSSIQSWASMRSSTMRTEEKFKNE